MAVTQRRDLKSHRFQSLYRRTLCKTVWLPGRGGSFIFSVHRILLRQKNLLALRVGSMVHRLALCLEGSRS